MKYRMPNNKWYLFLFLFLISLIATPVIGCGTPSSQEVTPVTPTTPEAKPQPPQQDTSSPIISRITTDISGTKAVINWETDENSTGQVEYGTTSAYGKESPLIQEMKSRHSVTLDELTTDTTYHFIVRSVDSAGNETVSEDKTFTTSPIAGKIIFKDDFSNPASGWGAEDDKMIKCGYEEGAYRIFMQKGGWYHSRGNTKIGKLSDFTIECDFRLNKTGYDCRYGIIFRWQDKDNNYRFTIAQECGSANTGCYSIYKVSNGKWTPIKKWTDSLHIKKGLSTQHLKLECSGQSITVYIDDNKLTTVNDGTFTEGLVALLVVAGSTTGADVVFDNILIYTPDA